MSYQAKRRPKVVVVLVCGLALLVASATRAQAAAARPWAVILCQFSDDAVHPVTAAAAQAFFSEAGTFAPGGKTPGAVRTNGMFDFWRDMSFGAINLTGTTVFGPFPLGITLAQQQVLGGAQPGGRAEKHRACTDAAAARGVKLNGFYGVIAVWSNDGGQFWGGSRLGVGEVALTPGSMNPTLAGHEMGHGFGLPHSYAAYKATMYGDPLDIMSAMTFGGAAAPTFAGVFGESGPGLNAASRAKLGWLSPLRVVDRGPGSILSVTLDAISALSAQSSSNPLLARVWVAPLVDYYAIEFQTKQAWDFGIPNNVVVVRWVPSTTTGETYFEKALLIGQSFVSLAHDRQFSLVSISTANDPTSAVVQISGVAPSTTAATSPSPNTAGWHKSDVTVTLTASNIKLRSGPPSITYGSSGAMTTAGQKVTVVVANEGVTAIDYRATDVDGNIEQPVHRLDVKLDKTAPVSHLTEMSKTSTIHEFRLDATDGGSGVAEIHYILNSGPEKVVTAPYLLTAPATGQTDLFYWAADRAGNVEVLNNLSFQVNLVVSPTNLAFSAPVGTYSPIQLVKVENKGVNAVPLKSFSSDSLFPLSPATTQGCGATLSGGSSCFFAVRFFAPNATAAFAYTAVVSIGVNLPNLALHAVSVTGTSTVPQVVFAPALGFPATATFFPTPAALSFPPTALGATSNGIAIELQAVGGPVVIAAASDMTTGTNTDFIISATTCGPYPLTLIPGNPCEVALAFRPRTPGTRRGAFGVGTNAPGSPHVLLLDGTGIVVANLLATPNRVDFGHVRVGSYAAERLSITNQGPGKHPLSGFSITGPDAGSFSIRSFLCDGATAYNTLPGDDLGVAQSCHLVLAYVPTSGGMHTATMVVSSRNGLVADYEVPLRGSAK